MTLIELREEIDDLECRVLMRTPQRLQYPAAREYLRRRAAERVLAQLRLQGGLGGNGGSDTSV